MHNFMDPQRNGCVISETSERSRTEVDVTSNGSAFIMQTTTIIHDRTTNLYVTIN